MAWRYCARKSRHWLSSCGMFLMDVIMWEGIEGRPRIYTSD